MKRKRHDESQSLPTLSCSTLRDHPLRGQKAFIIPPTHDSRFLNQLSLPYPPNTELYHKRPREMDVRETAQGWLYYLNCMLIAGKK
jgi:hypothetical protein